MSRITHPWVFASYFLVIITYAMFIVDWVTISLWWWYDSQECTQYISRIWGVVFWVMTEVSWLQFIIGSDNGMAPGGRQSVTWTNCGIICWSIYASLSLDCITYSIVNIKSTDGNCVAYLYETYILAMKKPCMVKVWWQSGTRYS